MLYECRHAVGPDGDLTMKWFVDSYFDLDIWIHPSGSVERFLLCYNKPRDEHAIAWTRSAGCLHHRVDDGEGRPGRTKASPVLLADGDFDAASVAERFREASKEMDPQLALYVLERIRDFPAPRRIIKDRWMC